MKTTCQWVYETILYDKLGGLFQGILYTVLS